jgi:hypothetical protein
MLPELPLAPPLELPLTPGELPPELLPALLPVPAAKPTLDMADRAKATITVLASFIRDLLER